MIAFWPLAVPAAKAAWAARKPLGVIALVLALLIGGWWLVHSRDVALEQARVEAENAAKLERALGVEHGATEAAKETIQKWKQAQRRSERALADKERASAEARAAGRELNEKLAKHDLDEIARRKPGLLERAINSGSADALRLLGCATALDQCSADRRAGTAGSDAPAAP